MEEKSVNRKKAKKHAQLKEFWRRYKKNKAAVVGLVLLCIIVGMAVFADLIVPYAKCVEQVGADRLQWPSVAHWFGTDEFGRDVFAVWYTERDIPSSLAWRRVSWLWWQERSWEPAPAISAAWWTT